jgi:hypothetical protein
MEDGVYMNHDQLFRAWQGWMSKISDDIAELVIAQTAFMDYSKKVDMGQFITFLLVSMSMQW